MRRLLLAGLVAFAFAIAGGAAVWLWPIDKRIDIAADLEGNPDRGAYVARMSGCIACHTDVDGGGQVLAGGPPLSTPFGTFYAPNITPDPTHGVGAWEVGDFAAALRHGASPQGEPYYPAFPYTFYTKLTDQDIADLWAAIWTVPPVAAAAPAHDLEFPFDRRGALKLWRAMFFDPGSFEPDPGRDELWNRGAYLVTGPAHCGACHTPRNPLGARNVEEALHGADRLPGGGKSPPITEEALRHDGWSRRDLVFALRTGLKPDGDSMGGSMGEVVREGTRFLSDEDLMAIATYLLPNEEQAADTARVSTARNDAAE